MVGSKLRPQQVPEVPMTQAEMVRLQNMAQRQNLERLTDYFSEVVDEIKPGVVWLEGLDSSGVVWSADGLVVTAAPRKLPSHRVSARDGDDRVALDTQVLSPLYPVAALAAPAQFRLTPLLQSLAESLDPGAWILHVAATRDGRHLHTPGNYEGVVTARCGDLDVRTVKTNVPLTSTSLGGGIFDLDGNVLALVVECEEGIRAIVPSSVEGIIQAADSIEGKLRRRYGFRIRTLDDRDRAHFKEEMGVVVSEVCLRMPAEAAGLEPGDIIQALDDTPVESIEDLERLTLPVAYSTFDLYVKRDSRLVKLALEAVAIDYHVAGAAHPQGIVVSAPFTGVEISDVAPGSPAARASLKPGDRLLTIGGRRQQNSADVRAALTGTDGEELFVVVRRGERKLGVFLN